MEEFNKEIINKEISDKCLLALKEQMSKLTYRSFIIKKIASYVNKNNEENYYDAKIIINENNEAKINKHDYGNFDYLNDKKQINVILNDIIVCIRYYYELNHKSIHNKLNKYSNLLEIFTIGIVDYISFLNTEEITIFLNKLEKDDLSHLLLFLR